MAASRCCWLISARCQSRPIESQWENKRIFNVSERFENIESRLAEAERQAASGRRAVIIPHDERAHV